MDLRQLRYFVGIADCGSMMRAAERLHVAQPALSVHMKNMEVELGCRLMQRTNRGVELTEEGQILYGKAKAALQAHQDIVSCFRDRRTRPCGTVSIGMPPTISPAFSGDLYRKVRDCLPEVNLYITDASTSMLLEWLTEGRIDLAIMFCLPENDDIDLVPLAIQEFCFVSRADSGEEAEAISFEEVLSRRLVVPCTSTTWRKVLDGIAEKRGLQIRGSVESESVSVVKSIILSGEASGILPRSCVSSEIMKGTMHARRIVDPEIRGLLSICSLRESPLNPAMRAVRDLVGDMFEEFGCDSYLMESVASMARAVPAHGRSVRDLVEARPKLLMPAAAAQGRFSSASIDTSGA